MKSSNELRAERADKLDALDVLTKSSDALTGESKAQFEALVKQVEDLDAEIELAEKAERLLKQKAIDKAASFKSEETKVKEAFNLGRAVKTLANRRPLDGAELEVHQEGMKENREAGVENADGNAITLPRLFVDYQGRTDFNVGTAGDGGNTVQTNKVGMVAPLRPRSVIVERGATVLSGLRGDVTFNPIAAGSIAWEGETDAAAAYYGAISNITLQPKRAGAFLTISDKLLRQSEYTIQSFLTAELERQLGQGLDAAFIEGGGSGEPTGILANSSIGLRYAGGAGTASGTNADGAAVAWADFKNLWQAVAEANGLEDNAYFLTTPGVIGQAMTTSRQASGVEGNFIMNETMQILGYPVVGSTNVPSDLEKGSSGTTLHALIMVGAPSQQYIGQWGGTSIIVDPYTAASTAQLKIWVHTWVDTQLIQPTAFAAIKDIDHDA